MELAAITEAFDDASAMLRSIKIGDDSIELECVASPDHWISESSHLDDLRIRAEGALDWRLFREHFDPIGVHAGEHPALLRWRYDHASLYFSSEVDDPMRLTGELLVAHRRIFGRFVDEGETLNWHRDLVGLLAAGRGKLAAGPKPVMHELAAYVQRAGGHPSVVDNFHPEEGVNPDELQVAEFGRSWVVARSFHVEGPAAAWLAGLEPWPEESY